MTERVSQVPLPIWSERSARVAARDVVRRDADGARAELDRVVVEEPLEIRLGREPVVVTMRTPGDDVDLALGFLYTEGVIASLDDLAAVAHAHDAGAETGNVVTATPAPGRALSIAQAKRALLATSACGLCGKDSIAAVRARVAPLDDATTVAPAVIAGFGRTLRAAQAVFDATGGLHAAGLFRPDGALVLAREDVGRHNAMDKLAGAALRAGLRSLAGHAVMFSGRAGFEVVQKAAVARAPVVCAVGAASSLAVDLAREVGVTLVGFVRGERATVYAHGWRLVG